MGWFDKKSWQLRRKIRDLQSELTLAEREGKYVVEQGLFFAELEEMGDATLMVLGTANHLDAEEETVIRTFFGRNGFTVENLRLDKTQKTLASVEIIPPEELTRRVARALKELGYRLVDDSEKEQPSDLEANTLTLSGIIRSTSALFAMHVYQLIISTPIKNNMEGNRLLHWMPLIRSCLATKVSPDVVNLCREPFVSAYNHYYGQLGQMKTPETLQVFSEETETGDPIENPLTRESLEGESQDDLPIPSSTAPNHTFASHPDDKPKPGNADAQGVFEAPAAAAGADGNYATQIALTLAQIYKSLIGVSSQQKANNAEAVLAIIARFFSAESACLVTRITPESPFTVQANSPGEQCTGTFLENAIGEDNTHLSAALATASITSISDSENPEEPPKAIIAPLALGNGVAALVYLAKPETCKTGAMSEINDSVSRLTRVFSEFPDLLVSDDAKKAATSL